MTGGIDIPSAGSPGTGSLFTLPAALLLRKPQRRGLCPLLHPNPTATVLGAAEAARGVRVAESSKRPQASPLGLSVLLGTMANL